MKEIYSRAHLVVAWLGPEEEDTSWLFAILGNIGKASSDSLESGDLNSIEDWDKKIEAILALKTAKSNYIERLNNDVAIYSRLNGVLWRMSSLSYWMRLWIIQEFSVARKVELLWGSYCLPTAHVSKLLRSLSRRWIFRGKAVGGVTTEESDSESSQSYSVEFIDIPGMKVSSFMEGVFTRRERYRRNLIKPDPYYFSGLGRHQRARSQDYDSLFRVLATTLALEGDNNYPLSTDPRDRVFSLLQLANDSGEFDLFPNYQMTSREVYTEAACIIFQQGHIDLLAYCQFPKQTHGNTMPKLQFPWVNTMSAAGDNDDEQRVLIEGNKLFIRGFCVDVIQDIGDVWHPESSITKDHSMALRYLHQVKSFCVKSPRGPRGVEECKSWAARIASHAQLEKDHPSGIGANDVSYVYEYVGNFDLMVEELEEARDLSSSSSCLRFWSQTFWIQNLHARRPFITNNGYVGVGPASLGPGDLLYLFPGSKTPSIIRALNGETFSLIGEAYVDGIMHGEAVKTKPQWKEVTMAALPAGLCSPLQATRATTYKTTVPIDTSWVHPRTCNFVQYEGFYQSANLD
ncbi:hypothetical protein V8E51_001481 [Hyaloscypha variabilis]